MSKKISACVVVYNEEAVIGRCLESVKAAADEIIVVHDGECGDNTLDICRRYGAKIFIRPRKGAMEFHLPFAFRQAAGDWILRIDADEFLSKELRDKIRTLARDDGADAYEFLWPIWDGDKYITKSWPRKLCLFRKEKISFLGVIHFSTEVNGRIEKSDLMLEHRPKENNFVWKTFKRKIKKWASAHAKLYLNDFGAVEKYNRNDNDWPAKVKLRVKFPLLLMPLEFFVTFLRNLLSGGIKEGLIGVRVALMLGIYRVAVNYNIFYRKNKMILKKIKNIILRDYSTDTALRYLPAVDVLKKVKNEQNKILEVGSGDLGITPYYKKSVTGLDVEYGNRPSKLLKKIKFGGKNFPFGDNEFDVTVSVDNIEHLPASEREFFLKEILRVTKKEIILVAPCGRLSYEHDIKLRDLFYGIHKKRDKFLEDHKRNGLPEADDLISMLKTSADALNKNIKITKNEKSLNLKVRYFIMKCKISENVFLSVLYYAFLFVLPLRRFLNYGNCYRRIIVAEII